MKSELTRRAMLAGSAGLAGASRLAGAPAPAAARPKYYHVSQSSINYQAEFNSGKMDIFSFMDTCRALDLDGLDVHVWAPLEPHYNAEANRNLAGQSIWGTE